MDRNTCTRFFRDPVNCLVIIMMVPTFLWLYYSIQHTLKIQNQFLLQNSYYQSNVKISSEQALSGNSVGEPDIENDIQKSQILYNYYSVITYLGNSAVLAATLLATEIGISLGYNWNRKKSAFEMLNTITLGDFLERRHKLEGLGIEPYNRRADYYTDREKLLENGKARKHYLVRDVLNTFDMICTGIDRGIIDEDLAFEHLKSMMFAYWRWAQPYIILSRMIVAGSYNRANWITRNEFSTYEKRIFYWKKREKGFDKTFDAWRLEWIAGPEAKARELFEKFRQREMAEAQNATPGAAPFDPLSLLNSLNGWMG